MGAPGLEIELLAIRAADPRAGIGHLREDIAHPGLWIGHRDAETGDRGFGIVRPEPDKGDLRAWCVRPGLEMAMLTPGSSVQGRSWPMRAAGSAISISGSP
jgi:hypothetical protein